ncbi:phage minor head protein [Porphyromonas sp. COT-290 OH860]|uniref:phage head morphogenesis protein n=1 Tax=Porphyromonas sp. COT-290 OH860 TaxID=1515615 RepID=UPI00052CD15B|nr:phage minor head protein [Porphyromonas sp. COT-290 OH860]KGN82884.1 hypothetical protein HQ41_08010 [Porphyromonas sp. COT-290 OH860]
MQRSLEVTDIVQLSDIIEIPTKWLHDKYAIPMAEEGEEIARRQPAMPMLPDYGMTVEEEEEEGKTLSEVYELNKAFRESKSYADFARQAKEITTTYNDKWQRTEYNTALNCAEAASNYRELKRKQQLFPYWEYKTVGDSKVRQEHQELDGIILPNNDHLWNEIYPPNETVARHFACFRLETLYISLIITIFSM